MIAPRTTSTLPMDDCDLYFNRTNNNLIDYILDIYKQKIEKGEEL